MAKKSQVDRVIEALEHEKLMIDVLITKLKAHQRPPKPRVPRKPVAVERGA